LADGAVEVDCLCLHANARLKRGRLGQGTAPARAARAINLEFENVWGLAHSDVHLTHAMLEGGAYAEALKSGQEGAGTARKLGPNALLIFALAGLGAVQWALFDLDVAQTIPLEAQAVKAAFPWQSFVELVASELCGDRAPRGDWGGAHAYAQQALRGRGIKVPCSGLTRWLETVALVHGRQTQATGDDVQSLGFANGDSPRHRLAYSRALGVLALSPGQLPGGPVADESAAATKPRGGVRVAITHLRQAAALADEIGLPGELWQIVAALGELHRTAGEADSAERAFARAARATRAQAAGMDDEGLRATPLAAEPVRRVLEQSRAGELGPDPNRAV
jgi:hypothetical protein